MNNLEIVEKLYNGGFRFENPAADEVNIFLKDPSCITLTFETFLEYAWIVATLITAILLFGWGIAAIRNPKNGTLEVVSKNFRNLFLIFCIFSAVKPIINYIWGEDLFAKACKTITIPVEDINKFLDENGYTGEEAYEEFDFVDSWADTTSGTTRTPADTTSGTTRTPNGTITISDKDWISGATNAYYSNRVIVYEMPDGSKQIKKRNGKKGTRAWLNNNPGNIRYTEFMKKCGAIGQDDKGFSIFPDETTGWQALKRLLRGKTYNNKTIIQAMHTYAPWADNNNPVAYANNIRKWTGLDVNRVMNTLNDTELNAMMKAIQRVEGWTVGKIERQPK